MTDINSRFLFSHRLRNLLFVFESLKMLDFESGTNFVYKVGRFWDSKYEQQVTFKQFFSNRISNANDYPVTR